jgi:hexosaminidase
MPRPVQVAAKEGSFTLRPDTTILGSAETRPIGQLLAEWLEPATGFRLAVEAGGVPAENRILLALDTSLDRLGEEGYALTVTPQGVVIRAPKTAGIFYGVQTFRQLMPPTVFASMRQDDAAWTVPGVEIEDYPRFRWRGAHLDVSRHFMPKAFVLKFIDLLALHKLNTFHWHLTDDQGWRIEIKKYPKLTEVGAWRAETRLGHERFKRGFDKVPHGGFYTQAEIREVVEYARQRFVTIVPEIEMPGHAQAAIAAYPELGNTGEKLPVWTRWGVNPNIFNPSEQTILFLQDVLSEVLELFPGTFIHVGGDEAVKDQWKASALAQARIRELGLKDEDELQSWFIRRMEQFLSARGRRLIGWDEILEGGLPPGATVMSWRGFEGGIAAAKSGHDVVMAPGSHTYFDHYQSQQPGEPLAIGGFTSLERAYSFEPVPPELTADEARHILGAQGQHWTEYMKGPGHVEYMAFPRMLALAEVVWTPAAQKDFAGFLRRMSAAEERLTHLQVNFRPVRIP